MKKSKIIIFIIILLLIILSIFTVIKVNQYNKVIEIANTNIDKQSSKNFYYEINNVEENSIFKKWVKDSKIKQEAFLDNNLVQTMFVDLTNNSACLTDEENKTYTTLENETIIQPNFINSPNIIGKTIVIEESSFADKVSFAFSIKSISTEMLDNKNTIKVSYKCDDIIETTWFDSTTLYPIRVEFDSNLYATYNLADCNLSDEEMVFNDFENYTEIPQEPYEDEYQVNVK